jgi:cobalt-zinc-cadmium efflux system protein
MALAALNQSRARSRRALVLAIAITGAILLAEVVGGILTNSLALLADAGHMASDLGALGLSLAALWLASRPPSARRTYGFHRAEVLAALANSLALMAISGYVFWEASRRISDPPDVNSGPMLAVATVGLTANVASAAILSRHARSGLNMRAAFLHVIGDAAASVGVIVAGVIMLTTGQLIADPLISVFIGVLILVGAFRLTWETTQVLLETTPPGLSTGDIQQAMLDTRGVLAIHDLHVWTVTSGFISLSAHAETDQARDQHDILVDLRLLLARRFGIEHATIQLETSALHQELEACCGVDSEEDESEHAAFHD